MMHPVATLGLAAMALLAVCRPAAGQSPPDPVPPHETLTIASRILGEDRVVNLWMPPAAAGAGPFDLVYMPDGGIDEDFPHIANTLGDMVERGEIAPVILVGIPNTVRRRDLTGPTAVARDREIAPVVGGSADFRRFIRDELVPAVEGRYPGSGRRAIVGESLAALFILETFFADPDLFHGYIAISPSLWWNDHALVRHARERLADWGDRQATLYLSCADETDIAPHVDELAAILGESAPPGLVWTCDPRPTERHDTVFRAAKTAGFRAVLRPPVAR